VLIEMSRKRMKRDINIMHSIQGVGDKTASNFLIEMGGDISMNVRVKSLPWRDSIRPFTHPGNMTEKAG